MIKSAYLEGRRAAFRKFALGPPTQVDQFVADVESGKDVLPEAAQPPAPGPPAALDGTTPMPPLPSFGAGSTVAPELAGAPSAPPPMMNPAGG
jgi:hypothetical protein